MIIKLDNCRKNIKYQIKIRVLGFDLKYKKNTKLIRLFLSLKIIFNHFKQVKQLYF